MEHTSELVSEGKLIHQHSYPQRAARWQELALEGIKIDHFDAARGIVREIKKSNKKDSAHIAQLKYYLFVLERNDIVVNYGVLEYPKLRIRDEVFLSDNDRAIIPTWEQNVVTIATQSLCPARIEKTICKKCAYFDFCFT